MKRLFDWRIGILGCAVFSMISVVRSAELDKPDSKNVSGTRVSAPAESPLESWKQGFRVRQVSPGEYHSIHTYYITSPESPDGRWVLYYASTTPEGHEGEIRIRERTTGKEVVLADNVHTEDAHRAACQQWACGGQHVVFHNAFPDGEWVVEDVEVATGKRRTLARGWQVGFGQPMHDEVPIYGPHWNPGQHRDVALLSLATEELRKIGLTADLLKDTYPKWVTKKYGERPISIFFPVLSPDLNRLFCKASSPAGRTYRSDRYGVFCFDLGKQEFLWMHDNWGHPAWHPNSGGILQVNGTIIDSNTGKTTKIPNYPKLSGSHPSFAPNGNLFTADAKADNALFGGPKGSWAVVVGDARDGEYVVLHRFDNSKGAQTWRRSHPHPAFSSDGKRIYFNVSDHEKWTQLYVAEIP